MLIRVLNLTCESECKHVKERGKEVSRFKKKDLLFTNSTLQSRKSNKRIQYTWKFLHRAQEQTGCWKIGRKASYEIVYRFGDDTKRMKL